MMVFLSTHLALPQEPATADSCRENLKLFYNAPPISTLPANERNGIIRVVLPDLKASEAKMGFDPRDITPEHLASLLRFTELATAEGERVAAVTYQDPDGCGNHGQCSGYLLGIGPHGVRSLVPGNRPSGLSVGGTWGAAVMSRRENPHPDLLVLATISGSEVAVACYRWQGRDYSSSCDVPCVRVLAHPDQP